MKDELRYKYKIKRKYFQHSQREVADCAIRDCITELYKDKLRFFVYYSFGSEADTRALIARLISDGKEVYLPRVEGKNMVAVRFYGSAEELKKGAFGTFEPQGQVYSGDFDVIIVPLLAVNHQGYRLGYGGGFYDRFLKDNPAEKAGIGYYLQFTEEIFQEERDVPIDKFICERGIINFGRTVD